MQALLGHDIDLPAEEGSELLLHVHLVKEVRPSAKPDQEVDIAPGCRLTSTHGPKHSNLSGSVTAGDLQDLGTMSSENLGHAETVGWAKFCTNLGPIPKFGLATRADTDRRLGRAPRVGAAKAAEDWDLHDLHRFPPSWASAREL